MDDRWRVGEVKGWMSPAEDVADRDDPPDNVIRLRPTAPLARAPLGPDGLGGAATAQGRQSWPQARLDAVEALWGAGFTMPGGAPETLLLARPLGLSAELGLLLLGGGLGGPARALSEDHGCRVISLEANAQLLDQARRRHGANDSVTIGGWDRQAPRFPPGSAHRVLSLEALRGAAPGPLLEGLAASLHDGGQIVLTELVAEELPDRSDREFAAWCRLDDRLPGLPRTEEVADALVRLGFTIRQQEDVSDRHIGQTLEGWRLAVRGMATGPRPTNHSAAAFVSEAELWLLRIRLMRRLGFRLMRWHAVAD